MMRGRSLVLGGASALGAVLLLWCFWLWQPERQLLKHHRHFLDSVENRKWSKVARYLDPDYADRWNFDRAELIRESGEIFRQFIVLTINDEIFHLHVDNSGGTVTALIRLEGTGSAVAMYARDEANAVSTPFVFTWRHRSWKPWDWALVRIDNPALELRRMEGF